MSTRAKSKRRKGQKSNKATPAQVMQRDARKKARRMSQMTHDRMSEMLHDVFTYLEEHAKSIPFPTMAILADVAEDIVDALNKKMTNSSDEEGE